MATRSLQAYTVIFHYSIFSSPPMIDSIKKTLHATVDKRANTDAGDYKHLVLSFIIINCVADNRSYSIKLASTKFDHISVFGFARGGSNDAGTQKIAC